MALQYNPNQMAEINRTGGGAPSAGNVATAAGGTMMMIPGMQAAGLATSLAGLGLSAYGQYQANETAKDNYKLALMQYNDWKKNQRLLQQYNQRQNDLSNTMAYGQYAQNLKKDAQSSYGAYNASIGR